MKLKAEIVKENQKAIIISAINYSFIEKLKSYLNKFSIETYFSSKKIKNFNYFDYVFIIDDYLKENQSINNQKTINYILIFIKKKPSYSFLKKYKENIKIIQADNENLTINEIEKILWFSFLKSEEKLLKINNFQNKEKTKRNFSVNLNKKFFLKIFILIVIIFHFAFFPFILLSSFFVYQTYLDLKKDNYKNLNINLKRSKTLYEIGNSLYQLVNKNYRLIGLSSNIENLININIDSIKILEEILSNIDRTKKVHSLVFLKNKSKKEINDLRTELEKLNKSLNKIEKHLENINQKLIFPFEITKKIKKELAEGEYLIKKIKPLFYYFEKKISQEGISKYLIVFANNMELRPGGGFIGSFAILEIGNFEVQQLKVYDVYDADGQLKIHVEPPRYFKKYLNMPHLFLRDSNFSPDFFENYKRALFFVEKELGISDFSGSILITTTAIENILNAFNNIYLPDYNEYINAKNFYLKTQLYVEKNFFPGSIQKQTFLSKLINHIIINLDQSSLSILLKNIKKSLDEKNIVIFFEDEKIQNIIDSFSWSGKIIKPQCLIREENCIIDYIFPYETNVGVNKANFFINRSFYLNTYFDENFNINHQLTIKYENNSPSEIFPTGYYRNYFQILLPKKSILKSITKDGVLINDYQENDDVFKNIGFYFEIPPKKKSEIKINYKLNDYIKKSLNIYQLIFQKQIGAKNSDFVINITLNKNLSIINQNFPALVKNNEIIYNTILSTDKIFLIEILNK